jgi:hypothetical protein
MVYFKADAGKSPANTYRWVIPRKRDVSNWGMATIHDQMLALVITRMIKKNTAEQRRVASDAGATNNVSIPCNPSYETINTSSTTNTSTH